MNKLRTIYSNTVGMRSKSEVIVSFLIEWLVDVNDSGFFKLSKKERKKLRNKRFATGELRKYILARDRHKCVYDGFPVNDETANIDHFRPWILGGKTKEGNLVTAHPECNERKGNTWLGRKPKKLLGTLDRVVTRRDEYRIIKEVEKMDFEFKQIVKDR